jgi:hypothetical protein
LPLGREGGLSIMPRSFEKGNEGPLTLEIVQEAATETMKAKLASF